MNNINIDIKMNIDKSLSCVQKNIKLGNQFDNKITKLNFDIPEEYSDITYKYCVFQDPYGFNILKELDTTNSILIENDITQFSGAFKLMLVLTNTELTETIDLNNDDVIANSDFYNCNIVDNYLEDVSKINLYSIPKNIYNDFDDTTKNLLNTYRIK